MTSEISKERLDVLDYMVESYSMWGTQDVPVHYRELHDLLATARREAKFRAALEAIKNAPGGGPAKRIAILALES